jgi:chromosome segregation protein
MKLAFVEAEGFRGFREKVRVDFATGFTVFTGRNGVGKSTIFDAIEFAITGTIGKYLVDKSGTDKLEDYIWWRGDGIASSNYVRVGFVGEKGESFTVDRDRNGHATSSESIEGALCASHGKPANALRHACQTSILRDELITSLSFDLTEGERFSLVYDAQGVIGRPEYGRRAQDIQANVKRAFEECERTYNEMRDQLNQSLTDVAVAKDGASKVGDVGAALSLIDSELGNATESVAEKLAAARRVLTERRLRLNDVSTLAEEERALVAAQSAINGSEFRSQKTKLIEQRKQLEAEARSCAEVLTGAQEKLALEEQQSELATSLAELLRHGGHLGLHDGHCPLCNATRTPNEFADGLRALEARLHSTGSDIQGARAAVEKTTLANETLATQLQTCIQAISELDLRETAIARREAALRESLHTLGVLTPPESGLGQTQQFVAQERSRLIDLERAILTLEASRSIDQIAELQAKTETLRKEADLLADRLARTKRAQVAARELHHAVQRARVEVSDERLASLRPVLTEFYQRLRPHSDWRTIRYSIRGDVTRLLSLRVGDDINPQFVFSSGQRRAAGLAFLFAVHVSRPWCRWQSLLLDDPVQHIDDFRALHLIEVLAAMGSTDRQIICGVEDPALADLMNRRLLGSSASAGLRYDLERVAGGSTRVSGIARVQPMLRGLMRQAAGESLAS